MASRLVHPRQSLTKAGERTRTVNIQLGRLKTQSVSDDPTTTYDTHHQDTSNSPGNSEIDPELVRLLDAWPSLPAAVRAGIMAIVEGVA